MKPALGLKRRLLVGFFLLAAQLLQGPLALSHYTAWALALPMILWCAKPFHRGLLEAVRARRADADALISISAWAGFLLSTVVVFVPERLPSGARYHRLREMAALIELSLLGAWIERLFQKKTGEAADKLLRRVPTTARVLRSGREETVTLREVQAGEFIVVEAGEQVPLDGEVVDGHSHVEESAWTGSGVAVEKSPGSRILGGAINKSRRLVLSVLRDKSEMSLSRILAAVRDGIALKRPGLRLSDGAARTFLPAALVAAVAAASLFFWKGPPPRKANALLALGVTLSCACPWILTLVTPLSLLGGIRRLASLGVTVRNPEILERMPRLDALIIDKKGILTVGKPEVAEVVCLGAIGEERLLRLAMAAERRSGHLFAEALRRRGYAAAPVPATLPHPEAFEAHPGRGVSAVLEGRRVMVGSLLWLRQNGIEPDADVTMRMRGRSESMVGIAADGEFVGAVAFVDALRPGVEEEVRELSRMGIEVVLASGDMNAVAHRVAEGAGISKVYSEVEEEEKVRIVAQLQAAGKKVAMVGEGFRDAPAISRADLGIVLAKPRGSEMDSPGPGHYGAGIDLALESADLVIPRRDLLGLAAAIRLSERIRRLHRQNLAFCFGANALLMLATAAAQLPALRSPNTPLWPWLAVGCSLAAILINTLTLRRYSL